MKIRSPLTLYTDFESFNEPQNDPKVLFKQIPIAVGCHLLSPIEKYYYSYFGKGCVSWFVKKCTKYIGFF